MEWVFSGIGVFVLSSIIAYVCWVINRSKDKTEKRIERFINEFRRQYKDAGAKLEILIPTGINTFKNDKEIRLAFEALMQVVPNHPLRNWKERVEKIGYKRFFSHVVNSGRILDVNSIESILKELE